MPGYWVKVGRQVHHLAATTEAAAVREGQAIANLVGAAVTLGTGSAAPKRMKRNPADSWDYGLWAKPPWQAWRYMGDMPNRVYANEKAKAVRAARGWRTYVSKGDQEPPARNMKRNPAPAAGGRTRSSTATEVRSPTRTSTVADTRGNVTVTGGAGAGANTTVNLGARGKPAKRRKTYDRNPLMQGQDFSGESWVIKGIAPNGRKAMAYAGTRAEAENEADYWHANYGIRAITVRRVAAPYRKGRK
jgi:hypothetical protein